MDIKSPQRDNEDKELQNTESIVLSKPSVISPLKDGKVVLGFQGFKLVNSNIKLFKPVDVKTSMIKLKTTLQQSSNIIDSSLQEKMQFRKKLHVDSNSDNEISQRIDESAVNGLQTNTISLVEKPPKKDNCSQADTTSSEEKPSAILLPKKDNEMTTKTKDDAVVTVKISSDRKERHSSSDRSRSSHSHSHRHSSYKKHRERSRSPRRNSGSFSSRERSRSSSGRRSSFSSRNRSLERSHFHSHSLSYRARKDNKSHSHTHHEHQSSDRRMASDGDDKQRKRSPYRKKSSPKQKSSHKFEKHSDHTVKPPLSDCKKESKDTACVLTSAEENSEKEQNSTTTVPVPTSHTIETKKFIVKTVNDPKAIPMQCRISDGKSLFSKLPSTFSEYTAALAEADDLVENTKDLQFVSAVKIENFVTMPTNLPNDSIKSDTSEMPETKESEPSLHPLLGLAENHPDTDKVMVKVTPLLEITENQSVADGNMCQVDPLSENQCVADPGLEGDSFGELLPAYGSTNMSPENTSLSSETADLEADVLSVPSSCSETELPVDSPEFEPLEDIDKMKNIEESKTVDSSPIILSPDNKIPALASKLKTVFQSLLKTDFKGNTVETIAALPKLNGILSNKTETIEYFDCRIQDGDNVAIEDSESTENFPNENSTKCDYDTSKSFEMNVNSDQADNGFSTLESAANTVVSPALSSCKVSPHNNKLKLHATTKTPLPAKKSYIQQVQNHSEFTHNNSTATSEQLSAIIFNNTENMTSGTEDEIANSTNTSEAQMVQINDDISGECRHIEQSVLYCDEVSNHGIPDTLVHSDLLRQDSSNSSTNDNDDGPRRSARIRTKKTEKSLHRVMIKTPQHTSNQQADGNSQNMDSTLENIASEKSAIIHSYNEMDRRISEDMSKEDIFKVRIHVARDVTDCPDLFNLLDENLYLTAKKKSRARKEIRRMVCECAFEESPDPDGPCGGNCLNRLLMIECSSRCHYAGRCTNKRFQHRIYEPTEVFKTSYKGWGIRAATDIGPEQLVMEYCGEVVDQREFTRRSLEYSKSNNAHFYFMALSQDEVIDATHKGNSSRFINHSCDPNAETQKWTVNGRLRVGFFTLRDIQKGEEITFDYQFERYGKVAQKCFCGTDKCRGYLGKAPNDNDEKDDKLSKLLSNDALSPDDDVSEEETDVQNQTDQDRKNKKKKLALFRDDTMEKDISKLLGGLRSSKEVLALSRLMVRCDTHSQRVMCLQVLKETTSQTRLKTFLQFHGLSIIWSWMVDVSGVEDEEAHTLKLDIITTLCMLPITNKNVIEDSKVLSVVQRWAKHEEIKVSPDAEIETGDSDKKELENGVTESDTEKESTEVLEKKSTAPIVTAGDEIDKTDDVVTKEAEVDAELADTDNQTITSEVETQKDVNEKIVSAAASLLISWKDLREIYRIPKRQKPVDSPDVESNSRDNSLSRTSSPLPKHSRTDDYDCKNSRKGRTRRDSSQERWRDSLDRSWDSERSRYRDRRNDFTDSRYSPGSSHSNENKRVAGRRKRRFSTDSDELLQNGRSVPWHCRTPRNSRFDSRMSRQEYRKRFEKDIQKREQEKKRRVEERNETDMTPNSIFPMNSNMGLPNGFEDVLPSLMGQDMSMMGQSGVVLDSTTFTPSGYSGNLIQINPTQPTQLDPYMTMAVNQQMGVNQVMQQPVSSYGMQMPVQQGYNMNTIFSQDPNSQMGMSAAYVDPNIQQLAAVGQQLICNSVTMMQHQQQVLQQQNIAQQQTVTIPQQQPQQSSNLTILGSQNGQAIVLLTAEQLQKLTQVTAVQQPQAESSHPKPIKEQQASSNKQQQQHNISTSESSKPESSKKSSPNKLPPNWKTATDTEGRIYYYHIITRQTQWDAPTWDGKEEDMVGKKEAEMDLSSTPTYDERHRKASRATGDIITEEGKKAKEAFRLKMSQFVVQCLSQFRKSDRKVGRITSTEDFKHLARKLTHNVMMKEIKQVRVWEDLDFNANVRHKTKEYVKKYMSRVGPVYQIRDDNSFDMI